MRPTFSWAEKIEIAKGAIIFIPIHRRKFMSKLRISPSDSYKILVVRLLVRHAMNKGSRLESGIVIALLLINHGVQYRIGLK